MADVELTATERTTLGKGVKSLRRNGITPVHLFGHGIDSMSLQCDTSSLKRVLSRVGTGRLMSVKVEKERNPRQVMVREVQVEPLTGEVLHVDFYQVKMTEAVTVEVPIMLVGEAPAMKLKENTLVQELNNISVQCLPGSIPDGLEIDISVLTEAGQVLRVQDIGTDAGITVLDEPEKVVVRIALPTVEVVEEPVAAEEVAEAAEAEAAAEE